ncbi:MAG: tail fiber domain-containing protein [Bacteroidota bacterium]
MKIRLNTFNFLMILLLMSTSAFAQLVPTNNLGIFPPPGPFNPNGKFTSLGESGGIPGPINGCDLYGFRAQVDSNTAVNLGIEFINGFQLPVLAFDATLPFIIEQRDTSGNGDGFDTGCGRALAWYFNSTTAGAVNDIVYRVFGSAQASNFWVFSDRRLKRNISTVVDPLDLLRQIDGVTYEYRSEEHPDLNLRSGMQYGFIAQNVEKVMPEAVQMVYDRTGNPDYLSVNYDMIIPILTEAVKVQDELIEQQNERLEVQANKIALMEERMARLEQLVLQNNKATTSGVSLQQNRPNPFKGMTTIEYNIPMDMNGAELVVYDLRGAEMSRISVASGKGSLNYDASNLNSGVYFYLIEHNGQQLARQKMIIQ